jgi:hypothetical protein
MARELLLIVLVVGCGRDQPAEHKAATAGPPLATNGAYRVDAAPQVACASGATCEARVVLTALGDYHVNQEYPFKFVGDPAPAVQLDGAATFAVDDARHGTLTIKFRPMAPGTANLAGTFKLSVCSDQACEIEAPTLALTVPVS